MMLLMMGMETFCFAHSVLQKKMLYLLEKQRQVRCKDINFYPEKFRFMPFMNTAVTVTISLLLHLIILSRVVKRVPNIL